MEGLIKKTKPVFEANPTLHQVHVTSDGQCFHNYHVACEHEKSVKGKRVLEGEDLPKTVTRDQAYAKSTGAADEDEVKVSQAAAEILAAAGIDPKDVEPNKNGQITKTEAEAAVKAKAENPS